MESKSKNNLEINSHGRNDNISSIRSKLEFNFYNTYPEDYYESSTIIQEKLIDSSFFKNESFTNSKNKEQDLLVNLQSQSIEVNKKKSGLSTNTNMYKITNNTTYSLINSNLNYQSGISSNKINSNDCNREKSLNKKIIQNNINNNSNNINHKSPKLLKRYSYSENDIFKKEAWISYKIHQQSVSSIKYKKNKIELFPIIKRAKSNLSLQINDKLSKLTLDDVKKINKNKKKTNNISNLKAINHNNEKIEVKLNANKATIKNEGLSNLIKSDIKENKKIIKNQVNLDTIEINLRKFYISNPEKLKEKVFKGPPNCFRWMTWIVLSNIPEYRDYSFYEDLLYKSIPSKVDEQIKKDLSRTLPIMYSKFISLKDQISIEQNLYRVLKAFAVNDREVSYVQGMNYIASFLLQISNYNEIESFYMLLSLFSNTFNNKFGSRGFYTEGFSLLNFYIYLFHTHLKNRNKKLYNHLINTLELEDDAWISKWIMTCFTMNFPIEVVARIWDSMLIHGLEFLVSFSVEFLESIEEQLFEIDDAADVIEFFKTFSPFESNYNEALTTNVILNNPDQFHSELNLKNQLSKKFDHIVKTSSNLTIQIKSLNIEDLILKAVNNKISDDTIYQLKKKWENTNNIDLSLVTIKYDLTNKQEKFAGSSEISSIYESSYIKKLNAHSSFTNQKLTPIKSKKDQVNIFEEKTICKTEIVNMNNNRLDTLESEIYVPTEKNTYKEKICKKLSFDVKENEHQLKNFENENKSDSYSINSKNK